METNKVGRPTILTNELKQKARLYIDECEDVEDTFHKTQGASSNSFDRIIKVKIPTIEGLAFYLNVARSTLYKWRDEDLEFSDIIDILLQKQANALINKGLSGDYNPTIAKVLLTKHGYREGTELTGADGEPLQIAIEDKAKIDNALEKIL